MSKTVIFECAACGWEAEFPFEDFVCDWLEEAVLLPGQMICKSCYLLVSQRVKEPMAAAEGQPGVSS